LSTRTTPDRVFLGTGLSPPRPDTWRLRAVSRHGCCSPSDRRHGPHGEFVVEESRASRRPLLPRVESSRDAIAGADARSRPDRGLPGPAGRARIVVRGAGSSSIPDGCWIERPGTCPGMGIPGRVGKKPARPPRRADQNARALRAVRGRRRWLSASWSGTRGRLSNRTKAADAVSGSRPRMSVDSRSRRSPRLRSPAAGEKRRVESARRRGRRERALALVGGRARRGSSARPPVVVRGWCRRWCRPGWG